MKKIILLALCVSLSQCSFLQKNLEKNKLVTISSDPVDSDIYSADGERIGATPMKLKPLEIKKITKGEYLHFIVRKSGFVYREVITDISGVVDLEIKLTPQSSEHFNKLVSTAYGSQINLIVKDLLKIQGMIFLKKYNLAKKNISKFQLSYPSIAASYTLLGNIFLIGGKKREAREQFLRALSLDQKDETAARFLNKVSR